MLVRSLGVFQWNSHPKVQFRLAAMPNYRALLAFFGFLLASLTAALAQYQQPVGVLPPNVDIKDVHIDQLLGSKLPHDATFKDQSGKAIQFSQVSRGLPILVLPIFYKCTGVCTVEFQGVLQVLDRLKDRRVGQDFDVVAISINPSEGPDLALGKMREAINSYPSLKGTEAGWRFLTGDIVNIRRVTDALGFKFTWDPVKKVVNHPAGLMVLTPQQYVSSYIFGASYDPAALRKSIDRAKGNKIGEKTTEIFFGCIHVDPITGQRSIVVLNFLKFLGVVTVVALLGTIIALSLRSRFSVKS